jgi:uracil-DNA glycosylase
MISDAPRSLRDPAEVVRRWSRLGEPRMAPLLDLVARIRAERGHTPFPDPLDGGAEARFLLLLETPGPSIGRTGLVSRDNVNGTAANLWRFLDAACIPRADTLIWNVVPYVIHAPGARNRAPRPAEAADGSRYLAPLFDRLPELAVVALSGRFARLARPEVERLRPGLPLVELPHPSPTYVNTSPSVRARIDEALAIVRTILADAELDSRRRAEHRQNSHVLTEDIQQQEEAMPIDDDRVEGSAKNIKGKIKEGIGKLTGDSKTEAEGKMDKAEGKIQNTVGGIKDSLRGDKRD